MASAATARPGVAGLPGIKIIDVDTHWSEPADLWTSRATPKYRDRVPQKKPLDGTMTWTIDGDISMGLSSASSVVHESGRKAEGIEFSKWSVEEVHPACSQMQPRLEVMDQSGIWAQVIYPNVLGFGGQGKMKASGEIARLVDADLRLVSTQPSRREWISFTSAPPSKPFPAPVNRAAIVTGRVTPFKVSLPSIAALLPSVPGVTLVDVNTASSGLGPK